MHKIRQVNDIILHSKPYVIDFNQAEHRAHLAEIIPIMQRNLHEAGGVGIASNQCAEIENPPQVIIVGNNEFEIPKERYPDIAIPKELILVNPHVLEMKEPYFPEGGEGCLSLQSPIRGRVERFKKATVRYQDIHGESITKTFTNFSAHIVHHECDHLQGIVFIQKIITELSAEQRQHLLNIIESVIDQPDENVNIEMLEPKVTFERSNHNELIVDEDALRLFLHYTDETALDGLCKLLKKML